MNKPEIKQAVIDDTYNLFQELYCGCELPQMDIKKVLYFVERALFNYENKLKEGKDND